MENSLTDLIILFDNKDPNETVTCQEVVNLLEQLNSVYKYAPELLNVLKTCYSSLCTYGRHPIIESQVENIIKKATEL